LSRNDQVFDSASKRPPRDLISVVRCRKGYGNLKVRVLDIVRNLYLVFLHLI
jgi:hypothetical protein